MKTEERRTTMAASRTPGVAPRPRTETERISAIIGELTDAYPDLESYIDARSSAGAGGSSGSLATPLNLQVFAFLNGMYWDARIDPLTDGPYPQDGHSSAPPCATWRGGITGPRCGRCEGCGEATSITACLERNQAGSGEPRCGRCENCINATKRVSCLDRGCGADPDNWRSGFKLTAFGLESSIRNALGFGQLRRLRPDGYEGHGTDQRVIDALQYIQKSSDALVDRSPQLATTVREELARIAGRCKGMIDGHTVVELPGYPAECQHCGLTTVHSDSDQAVCVNVDCQRDDGTRRCWQRNTETGEWAEIDEPDKRGYGRNLSYEQLMKRVYDA